MLTTSLFLLVSGMLHAAPLQKPAVPMPDSTIRQTRLVGAVLAGVGGSLFTIGAIKYVGESTAAAAGAVAGNLFVCAPQGAFYGDTAKVRCQEQAAAGPDHGVSGLLMVSGTAMLFVGVMIRLAVPEPKSRSVAIDVEPVWSRQGQGLLMTATF